MVIFPFAMLVITSVYLHDFRWTHPGPKHFEGRGCQVIEEILEEVGDQVDLIEKKKRPTLGVSCNSKVWANILGYPGISLENPGIVIDMKAPSMKKVACHIDGVNS